MEKILLIIGNDNISKRIITYSSLPKNVFLVRDDSTNIKRIFKLLLKKRINLKFLIKTLYCDYKRRRNIKNLKVKIPSIKNNDNVIKIIKEQKQKYI